MYLTVDQVKNNSPFVPYAVYGGKVYSFKLSKDDVFSFNGECLSIIDNKVVLTPDTELAKEKYKVYLENGKK